MKNFKESAIFKALAIVVFALVAVSVNAAPPSSFYKAKVLTKEKVYYDRTNVGDTYCGCKFRWVGASGGRTDLSSCGYKIRSNKVRAERTEWEHIKPASSFGHLRQCWQNGGRKNCKATDPVFNTMEADMFNLTPVVGEINADRSNYDFGVLPQTGYKHGQCDFKVDFKQRIAEPSDKVKGLIARTYFYMHDTYDLKMSRQQQQLLMAWDRKFPVTAWELEREKRIAKVMGRRNLFVTGDKTWTLGHKNSGVGVTEAVNDSSYYGGQRKSRQRPVSASSKPTNKAGGIKGNKNSNIYHLPTGCPSYSRMSDRNAVFFESEREAQNKGFRKAGNCR